MSEKTDTNVQSKKKSVKKKKSKYNYLYFYLFVFVFVAALAGFSYLVKSYSPNIDVTIGNNESLTLSESDMDVEIKSVDERLKWIQMEDEMPTVALRDSEKQENPLNVEFYASQQAENIEQELRKQEASKKSVVPPPMPTMSDIQKVKPDFRMANVSPMSAQSSSGVIPLPIKQQTPTVPMPTKSITRVFLSGFSSLEEAMAIQQEINSRDSSISPFIKVVNDSYIVQIGSFSDKEKALVLQQKIKDMGYSPQITTN